MSDVTDPEDVPLYEDRASRDRAYSDAEAAERPFFAIETYEEGYALTYDLLPAGYELAPPARKEIDERTEREVEAVVGDNSLPTTEVTRSLGPSLGQIAFFEREPTARRIAAVVAEIALDEANWVEATPPENGPVSDPRRN